MFLQVKSCLVHFGDGAMLNHTFFKGLLEFKLRAVVALLDLAPLVGTRVAGKAVAGMRSH